MYEGSINGLNEDPNFKRIENRDYFENDLSVDFAEIFVDDYGVQNENCSSTGSQLTSVQQLLLLFDELQTEPVIKVIDTESVDEDDQPNEDPNDSAEGVESSSTPISEAENNNEQIAQTTEEEAVNVVNNEPVQQNQNATDQPPDQGFLSQYGLEEGEVQLFIILSSVALILIILLIVLLYFAWQLLVLDQRED